MESVAGSPGTNWPAGHGVEIDRRDRDAASTSFDRRPMQVSQHGVLDGHVYVVHVKVVNNYSNIMSLYGVVGSAAYTDFAP